MANRRTTPSDSIASIGAPAKTPDGREQQLIAAAVDLAEQQLRDGSASAQVITHYLKLGSSRERLEQMRLEYENELTKAKIDSLASQEEMKELYSKAMRAFSSYKGVDDVIEGEYIDEDPDL